MHTANTYLLIILIDRQHLYMYLIYNPIMYMSDSLLYDQITI